MSARSRMLITVLNSSGVSLNAEDFGVASRAELPSGVAELRKAANKYLSFLIFSMKFVYCCWCFEAVKRDCNLFVVFVGVVELVGIKVSAVTSS